MWFIGLSGLLLVSFSFYIYFASASSRREIFMNRIKNKALDTKEIYNKHDKLAEQIIISIPEQSEYVFDEGDQLIFSINDAHDDFKFTDDFFRSVREKGEYEFNYKHKQETFGGLKEGYAFFFRQGDKGRIGVITAYDVPGHQKLSNLILDIIVGNIFFLAIIGLSAYVLLARGFSPLKDLVAQSELVQGNELNFRLSFKNPRDEIGIVATSFNKVLDKIQALAKSQKSFVAYASHELRTPLAAINGILETSVTYDKDNEAIKASLTAARKEIQKATALVNGLLQLAKVESTDTSIEKTKLNLVDVLLDAISFYKLKNPAQGFLFDIEEAVPKDVSIEIVGHAQLLRTAFINLIDNASKYSHQQRIEINLMMESPEKIFIQIIDRGIGLANEDWIELMDPFFRGKNAKTFDGFGLGLSLTQRILALHQGEIILSRNKFSGVTATVILPAFFNMESE